MCVVRNQNTQQNEAIKQRWCYIKGIWAVEMPTEVIPAEATLWYKVQLMPLELSRLPDLPLTPLPFHKSVNTGLQIFSSRCEQTCLFGTDPSEGHAIRIWVVVYVKHKNSDAI